MKLLRFNIFLMTIFFNHNSHGLLIFIQNTTTLSKYLKTINNTKIEKETKINYFKKA
jgi:hypothetical protein